MSGIRFSEDWLRQRIERAKAAGVVTTHKIEDGKKGSKYRNSVTRTEDGVFPSKKEALRWGELRLLEKAGKIRNLKRQVRFVLAPAVMLYGRQIPALRYYADATYEEAPDWEFVVEDAKGYRDKTYKVKRHLMMSVHGIEIREV